MLLFSVPGRPFGKRRQYVTDQLGRSDTYLKRVSRGVYAAYGQRNRAYPKIEERERMVCKVWSVGKKMKSCNPHPWWTWNSCIASFVLAGMRMRNFKGGAVSECKKGA